MVSPSAASTWASSSVVRPVLQAISAGQTSTAQNGPCLIGPKQGLGVAGVTIESIELGIAFSEVDINSALGKCVIPADGFRKPARVDGELVSRVFQPKWMRTPYLIGFFANQNTEPFKSCYQGCGHPACSGAGDEQINFTVVFFGHGLDPKRPLKDVVC
jgi:hypothetical protein